MNKIIISTLLAVLAIAAPNLTIAKESICYGTTSNGRLEAGVQLPKSGSNYVSYSDIAHLVGRTFVHSEVKQIVIDAYKHLEKNNPTKFINTQKPVGKRAVNFSHTKLTGMACQLIL